MKLLKIGISGIRGIVGDTLTPGLIMDFASAFGLHEYLGLGEDHPESFAFYLKKNLYQL
jgi:hypothetical protein